MDLVCDFSGGPFGAEEVKDSVKFVARTERWGDKCLLVLISAELWRYTSLETGSAHGDLLSE